MADRIKIKDTEFVIIHGAEHEPIKQTATSITLKATQTVSLLITHRGINFHTLIDKPGLKKLHEFLEQFIED